MSYLQLPSSFINNVLEMGFPHSALKLAHQATNSYDSNILLEWILTHEDEIYMNNTNKIHPTDQIIQKLVELDFSKNSVEIVQRQTHEPTSIEWLNDEDFEEYLSSTTDQMERIKNKQEENKKIIDTLLNDLLKYGFDKNDIETCFIELKINTTEDLNLKTKLIECMDWLINNSQRKAQLKAKEIERSQRRLRIPAPIKLNNYQASTSYPTTRHIITNNFLKEVHLSGRHQINANDEQEPPLTPEEAIMVGIHENLRRQSWTIHNLDHLHLIQKYIKIVARIIDEDRHHIKRYSDDEETQPIRPTTVKSSTKKIFTLADLTVNNRMDYRPRLATSPRNFDIPSELEEADWDPSLLKELDRIAIQLNYCPDENYRQLANRLIQECHISSNDQKSIIRAIFVWITNHIHYDSRFSERDNSRIENEQKMDELCQLVLNTQSCVCVGYAILFKRMCQYFNIRVDYVGGYTKIMKFGINDTAENDKSSKLAGHAWTIVYLDGKTYFTDPTWSEANWSLPSEMRLPSDTYYLVLPEYAIYQFRPDNNCDQHLDVSWSIEHYIREPCFYPNYFRSKFTLEDLDTEWYCYRLIVDRSKQTSLTKTVCINTRKYKANSRYPLKMYGHMYWGNELNELAVNLSPLERRAYEHKLDPVEFKPMDLTYADNHLNDKSIVHIAALENIPIYPPNLNVYQIRYGLLRIFAIDQSNGHYKPIFECIFEFQ